MIPQLRIRAAARFAQSSILEILHQQTVDDPGNTVNSDLRPSQVAAQPSLYRVDFAPVFVPAFNSGGEGLLREIENYSYDPEDNGTVEMTEAVVGTYPKSLLSGTPVASKTYQPTASDAGDFKLSNGLPSDEFKTTLNLSSVAGEFATDSGSATGISITEGSTGVTFDTTAANKRQVAAGSFAIAKREFFAGSDLTQRVRAAANQLYKVRYHITSTQASNKMPMVRPRVHTVKFGYTQKFEIGGAYNTGGGAQTAGNNLIALQALPGVGTQNPDKISTENGGYYTLIMNTPIATDMNPTNPSQVQLNAQAGPGVNASSNRDIKVALELIDSLDTADLSAVTPVEHGNCTVDKIEVGAFSQVSD